MSNMNSHLHIFADCNRQEKLNLAITLYTFAQTLGLTLFEKNPIKELFDNKNLINNQSDENQLSLWDS